MTEWAVAWSRRLENVLQDRTALDAFRAWLANTGSAQPLELHFAIRAYSTMVRERHPKCVELAKSIHTRYISLRTGCCTFIPSKIRQEVGLRVKTLHPTGDPRLFEPILPYVDDFLRKQHEQFCTTEEFIDAFNRVTLEEQVGTTMSTSMSERSSSRMNTSSHSHNGTHHRSRSRKSAPFLTAETLMKSQHDRETTLGESQVERMYPGPRNPYVCHATTSQHDSAVSSSFSSEANRSIRLSSIREEHIRGNPPTYTIPRVERITQHQPREDGVQFDHETDEGRRYFYSVLSKKLNREQMRRRRNEATERQIKELELSKQSARDVIQSTDCDVDDVEEDDLERYVEKMREESVKASANRSPRGEEGSFAPSRGGGLDRSTLERSLNDRSIIGAVIDPIPGFAPPSSYTTRFAPPPTTGFNTTNSYFKERYYSSSRSNPVYDSSGIESMTSDDRRKREKKPQKQHGEQLMTISYKGSDGVPVVAHVNMNGPSMTLKEFRRHFSISSHANMQFFFKTQCEDGSAPYQLLLMNDDSSFLPLFDGKITAECKQLSPE